MGLIHSGPCLLQVLGFDSTWGPPEALAEGASTSGALRWRIDAKKVMTLTLSAPEKRNTLSLEVLEALQERLLAARGAERDRVRVVLVEAQGNVFSSGHNFGDFAAEKGREAHERTLKLCSEVNMLLQEIPQPTLAVVQGLATAAGCQLACSCDLVLAADSAAFQLPGAATGGFCHTPAVSVAARASSLRFAVEMALLAERVPAERAERMGLVNRVVPRVTLFAEARRLAEKIAAITPENLQRGKLLLYEQAAKPTLAEKYRATEPAMLDMFASDASQANVKKFAKGK
ncbi:Echdc3 [Symbiodinium natans]|uniref:Echdc3 protein n=1 Tax=Symbiodinium natans TaxID=878477 RepID=A0A812JGH4_9DINO|nr:Echdc3 [Symbiodinium natans]